MKFFIIMAVVLVICGSSLYMTTSSYDTRRDKLATLDAQIAHAHEQAAILNAEWSYLSRPERVLSLSSDLLQLQPVSTDRVLPLEAIPFRTDSSATTTRGETQ